MADTDGTHVRYIGTSDSRAITASDWESLGIEQDDIVWDASNDRTVPIDVISDGALQFLEGSVTEWAIVTPQQDHDQLELDIVEDEG